MTQKPNEDIDIQRDVFEVNWPAKSCRVASSRVRLRWSEEIASISLLNRDGTDRIHAYISIHDGVISFAVSEDYTEHFVWEDGIVSKPVQTDA